LLGFTFLQESTREFLSFSVWKTNVTNSGLSALDSKQEQTAGWLLRPAEDFSGRDVSDPLKTKKEKTVTIIDALFGCWHRNTSFPQTSRRGQRRSGGSQRGTYIVCLDCGKEFAYDWQKMRTMPSRKENETYASTTVEAKAS
jgi:hypothetical protein